MYRIGINGLGRIGRAIFRNNLNKKWFEVVAVNDINPDNNNIAYQLNYDTLYDQLHCKFNAVGDYIANETEKFKVFHEHRISDVDWSGEAVDFVIDASGIQENVSLGKRVLEQAGVKKIVVTHSPEEVDFTMVIGANEEQLNIEQHHVIASSICDATAIGPVLRAISQKFGIESGHLTTMHPWLGYQNLMDGPASSWSHPGEIYHHFALGRSAVGNLIPKPTSALEASCKVVNEISSDIIGSYSIRTPTQIVGCADLTLLLQSSSTEEQVIDHFKELETSQEWDIIHNNFEPLVSLDFKCSPYSANIDHRFTSLVNGNLLKLVIWYDNEWGYSLRVLDQLKYIATKLRESD